MSLRDLPDAGYAFVPGVFQYSAGVRALAGFRIERVRFARLLPLRDGFARIAAWLHAAKRPLTAFCACELRSPAPFTEDRFHAFNRDYADVLREWGLLETGANPVARSNVCPEIDPPAEPGFHAFCYAVPDGTPQGDARPAFVVAGSGEVTEGQATYRDHVVAPGDTSAAGMRAKARFVLAEMQRRMAALGATWADTTGVQSLHRVRHPSVSGRRDRTARRRGARPDLALRPPADRRAGFRDGLPRGGNRTGGGAVARCRVGVPNGARAKPCHSGAQRSDRRDRRNPKRLGWHPRPSPFQVVDRLEVHPVLRRGAERLAEPDRHLRTDRALAVHDPGDGIVRHMDVLGELAGTQTQNLKLVPKETAGMDRGKVVDRVSHRTGPLGGSP
jgi:hypothetical protein